MRQVKLRPRRYARLLRAKSARDLNRHGHASEYAIHAISIICNLAFVFGSFCFFSMMPWWGSKIGAHCFLGGALVMGATSFVGVLEHRAHLREKESYRDAAAYDQLKLFFEEICYMLGSAFFVVGSIFYEPRFENTLDTAKEEHVFSQWGATTFVVGSAFYVLASYLNAISIAHEGVLTKAATERDGRGLIQLSLFCTQFGSVLFFAGSFLYQAKLDECTTGMAPRIPVDQGSLMYVSGSACYLIQSLLSLALTVRKHGTEHAPPASPKVWANLSPKASSPSRRGTMVNVHDV